MKYVGQNAERERKQDKKILPLIWMFVLCVVEEYVT
jgi:hypothetical protein